MKRVLLLVALLVPPAVQAQEVWCTANPSNCVMSETFTYTAGQYTLVSTGMPADPYSVWASPSTKPGKLNAPVSGISAAFSMDNDVQNTPPCCDFDDTFLVETTVLSDLPNRDPTAVPRYLRTMEGAWNGNNDHNGADIRMGYAPINLATGAGGNPVKRIAIRWYEYHSPTYDFAFQKNNGSGGYQSCSLGDDTCCTNGKIIHSSQSSWGQAPMITYQSNGGTTNIYSFVNSGGWTWTGQSSFEGFFGAPRTSGQTFGGSGTANWRGKWWRFEAVIGNPRQVDAAANGYSYQVYAKNVTDSSAEVEDMNFGPGGSCTGCMATGPSPFSWSTGIYPTSQDMSAINTEFFRAGFCRGWKAWLFMVVAAWDTNAGQRIGAASEVEGSSLPSAPTNLRIISLLLTIGSIAALATGGIFYAMAARTRRPVSTAAQ